MALEVFGLLDQDGCSNDGTHIFCGKTADLVRLAKPLQEYYDSNRRKKKVWALSERILASSKLPSPLVRLDREECKVFMEALEAVSKTKSATHSYVKLYKQFYEQLAIF